jgi:hypothetical protein
VKDGSHEPDTFCTATNFAVRFIPDARVRANYVGQAQAASREIEAQVISGAKTAEEGVRQAVEMRNALLDAGRLNSSDIGRALAEAEKATGLSMEQLQAKYAVRLFGRNFGELAVGEQDAVFLEIVRAARHRLLWRRLHRICFFWRIGSMATDGQDTAKMSWLPTISSSVRYPGGWLRPHYLQLDRA